MNTTLRASLAAGISLILLASCSSEPMQLDGGPPHQGETTLGEAEGESTGLMLFQVIPIGQNERFGVAYENALKKQPGATRIANATISENWFWAYILNGYSFKVKGLAVK
jgi:hypothetical protein